MKKPTETRRVIVVNRGDLLSQEVLDVLRDPERLVSGRHCRRLADGRLEARREFKVSVP